jgi:type VI secretion system protein ImpM
MGFLERLIATPLVTAPAIWGKLPAHADFVRSGMRHAESEDWCTWLAGQGPVVQVGGPALATAALPTSFVLPPGTLPFARRHFVVGVISPSIDRMGRRHVLLVYQLAHPRWLSRHFTLQASEPRDWLFWLGRAVARHAGMPEVADVWALARAIDELWQLHAPAVAGFGTLRRELDALQATPARMHALLERLLGVPQMDDPALRMSGVRYLPWTDWPQCLKSARAGAVSGAFWQQDAVGGFVNAARRLDALWSGAR